MRISRGRDGGSRRRLPVPAVRPGKGGTARRLLLEGIALGAIDASHSQMPRGAQIPAPPGNPAIVGQQASPSSQGERVPVMQLQPAERQGPAPQSPSLPQYPEQQSMQFDSRVQVAGQTTPSPLQVPAKHWLGGTHVPDPPGASGLSAQQTRPGVHEVGSPGRQRHPSSAQGRICAEARNRPIAAPVTATIAACPARASSPRRLLRRAKRRVSSSKQLYSMSSLPSPHDVRALPTRRG